MTISNVATPDVAFFRIVNNATKASGKVMDAIRKNEYTEMTFTSPKSGGTLSPEAWETMRQRVAAYACREDTKPLLDRAQKAAFKLDRVSFNALQKRSTEAVKEARQADRTAAGRIVGTFIGELKAKARVSDQRKAGVVAKPSHRVKPLQERVNIHVNKALGQIMANADKTDPDHLKNQAKVVELLKDLAKLTKAPAKSVSH